MLPQDAQLLLQRYLAGECTAAERELVDGWFAELGEEHPVEPVLEEAGAVHDRMLMKIRAELEEKAGSSVRRIGWRRYVAAAAAALIVAIGGWLLWSGGGEKPAAVPERIAIEAKPGGDKAILTLGNGQRVVLDSVANGVMAMQGNHRIVKEEGQLDYQSGDGRNVTAAVLNTLTTPKGGQYKLILPDGTKVWLDAASSITYPTAFIGKKRQVSITGQAYFEVVHDPKQPFEVSVQGQTVRDIGTSFNINAYSDEPAMKVTLATGVVAVGQTIVLKEPGQQAEWRDSQLRVAPNADLGSVLAWKNGLFYLTSADIATVMRQVSRWYDIDIVFEKGVPAGHITGELPRATMLSNILQVLQTSGVHFRVEGKTIHVMP